MVERDEFIGRATASQTDPNTSDRFNFWLRQGIVVNPFDVVAVEQVNSNGTIAIDRGEFVGSRTYGIVLNLEHRTDAPTHLSNFIANDFGENFGEPQTPRQGTTVAKVAVLSNDDDIYMPVPNEARVCFADERGIHIALGLDTIPERRRVPAGLLRMSNGTQAVVYADLAYILGPEGAHVNITGISGLATKTSYIMFLLQSIMQTLERQQRQDEVAIIILNVKHSDLLHIDEEPKPLSPEQLEMWDALGLQPRPFRNVHYFLPCGRQTMSTREPNSFPPLPNTYNTYGYALSDCTDKLDLLFSHIPDPWETLSTIVAELMKGLEEGRGDYKMLQTWNDLLNRPPLVRDGEPKSFAGVPATSVRRFLRHLRRIVKTRTTGLFVAQRPTWMVSLSDKMREIRGGHVYVVDIAKLTDDEQTLVFGDILRTIYELYAEEAVWEEEELPRKVIIFVDELNKYAPKRERESPIIEQVLDIAERGRSFGLILFSAQQFLSAVHSRVTGNCATLVIGRSNSSELAESDYRFLDPDVKVNVTRFNKGEVLLCHAVFRQPIRILFPRPAYLQPS